MSFRSEINRYDSPSLLTDCLRGNQVSRSPFWFMRQAGRYMPEYREIRKKYPDFLSMCYSPAAATEITLQPVERFEADAAILFSDILVIPDALGVGVKFIESKGPVLDALVCGEDLSRLRPVDLSKTLAPVYDAVSAIRARLDVSKTLIGFSGAPWTLACYMVEGEGSRDFSATRRTAYGNSIWFSHLIDIITQAVAEHLLSQIEAGADVVQIFDSWAGLLPDFEYEKWVINPTIRIVEILRGKYPDITVIGFPRGSGMLYESYAVNTGVDAVAIDEKVPLLWAKNHLQPHVVVQGNLDPLLLATDKEGALLRAREIISVFGDGNFVFNLGHGIIPQTPVENVSALSEMLISWRG